MAKYSNSGWRNQTTRHSNAKKYGHAGGVYSTEKKRLYDEKGHEIMTRKEEKAIQSAMKYQKDSSDVVELPIYQIKGKKYYRDVRLGEYRNVKDPSDTLDINIPNSMLEKPTRDYIEGETFPTGLIKSKESVLMPKNYDDRFYFVSDYWTATRYPKTPEGLRSAKHHVAINKKIDKEIAKEKKRGN